VKYWPVESLRTYFEQTCETNVSVRSSTPYEGEQG